VLISQAFRKCVTFLYAESHRRGSAEAERLPVGSAFHVGVELFPDAPGVHWAPYAVTARHVVEGHDQLWLRVRGQDIGDYKDWPIPREAWYLHPHTDIALTSLDGVENLGKSDSTFLRLSEFASRDFVQRHEVGEGDDVFFSGLFIGHYGRGVPLPIVRFGNLALMPREPVEVEISHHPQTWASIEAYLVEARSWGGQSGSPAFLSFNANRHMGSVQVGIAPPFALLGLVQGTWKDPRGMKAPDPSGEGMVEINMGISVVVPAYKIEDALMDEELVAARQALAPRVRQ